MDQKPQSISLNALKITQETETPVLSNLISNVSLHLSDDLIFTKLTFFLTLFKEGVFSGNSGNDSELMVIII